MCPACCGCLLPPLPAGPKGIAAILAQAPEIMLCKPTTNDRWDRRAVELSAYLLHHGHCNVPEVGAGGAVAALLRVWMGGEEGGEECRQAGCRCRPVRFRCCPTLPQLACKPHQCADYCLPARPPAWPCLQDWDINPELGVWVKRQRIARAAGQLRCGSTCLPGSPCLPGCWGLPAIATVPLCSRQPPDVLPAASAARYLPDASAACCLDLPPAAMSG